jgi:hypothetical protein
MAQIRYNITYTTALVNNLRCVRDVFDQVQDCRERVVVSEKLIVCDCCGCAGTYSRASGSARQAHLSSIFRSVGAGEEATNSHASVIRVHDALAWAEACCVVRVCALEVRTVTRAEIPPQAHLNRSRNLPTMWSKTLLASFQLTDSARGVSAHQTIGVRERTRTLLHHAASAGVSTAV